MIKNKNSGGQTLLEVVIATSLLIIALTVMVAAVANANANNRRAKERAVATRVAQGGQSWLRGQRDTQGWSSFKGSFVGTQPQTRCLTNFNATIIPSAGACTASQTIIESKATYYVELITNYDGSKTLNYQVVVKWWSGRAVQDEVVIDGRLTEWQ
jgi:type II secretory pathway pseudopilin PulG